MAAVHVDPLPASAPAFEPEEDASALSAFLLESVAECRSRMPRVVLADVADHPRHAPIVLCEWAWDCSQTQQSHAWACKILLARQRFESRRRGCALSVLVLDRTRPVGQFPFAEKR